MKGGRRLTRLSIIVPCMNEEEMITIFFKEVSKVVGIMTGVVAEYIFVDDGSTDHTLSEIKKLNSQDSTDIHYISFSRNFGKESALYAGLKMATGDFVVVMDVDLQDPPSLLPQMYNILQSDNTFDCVGTKRTSRGGEPIIRSFFSNLFYKVINKISSTRIVNGARDYRMMTRRMINAILSMTEYNRFSKGIFSWVGFRTKYLEYKNIERKAGETSWSFWKLFKYSIDGITDFSDAPLSIASWVGTLSFIGSIIGMIIIVFRYLMLPNSSINGWASLVCICMLFGGLQLLCLGIVGKYIGKIYIQVKNRPLYIVKEQK